MNDRAALYAAVLAHPDEDTPRLVLADWLEENGDARYAAFIRKQIDLAKVPEWNPPWVRTWHEDRNALTGRGFDQFVPTLPDAMSLPPLTSFHRGFPWHVESTFGPFLEHADQLFVAVPLQAVTIRTERDGWREPIDLTALFTSPHLARLKQLTFTLTRFAVITVQQMQACPYLNNITALHFRFSSFEPGALREFFRLPLIGNLESLSFESCSIAWGDLAVGIAGAGESNRLKSFAFTPSSTLRASAARVFDLPLLRKLTELKVGGYEMSEAHIRALCESPAAVGLESLTLNGIKPGVPGIKVIAESARLRSLKRLRLKANGIGPVAAKALAGSPHLAGLRVLDLAGNRLGDKGAAALAAAPFMSNLIELELMHGEIGDAGAEALASALSADTLIHLYLRSSSHKVKLGDDMKKKLRDTFGGRVFA